MSFAAIVLISLTLQCVAVYYSFRLINLTGHTLAWVLLSSGIATMAARRFITLAALLSVPVDHRLVDYSFEIIGVLGSMLMLVGVLSIKPIFMMIRDAGEEQRTLAESLQEALNNIKILKGMLPICANCKKIRDDEGYWQRIETYISKYSDTKFTHGICPDCVRKLYPEYSEKILHDLAEKGILSVAGDRPASSDKRG